MEFAGTGAAGATGAEAAGAAGVAGIAFTGAGAAGAGAPAAGSLSITPPLTLFVWWVVMYDRASVAAKKMAAATPVDFDMKFDEPVAPNRLPDAPEPKAAPMSAPLPCCSSTRPIMAMAEMTCTMITRLNKEPMLFHSKLKVLYRFVSTALKPPE